MIFLRRTNLISSTRFTPELWRVDGGIDPYGWNIPSMVPAHHRVNVNDCDRFQNSCRSRSLTAFGMTKKSSLRKRPYFIIPKAPRPGRGSTPTAVGRPISFIVTSIYSRNRSPLLICHCYANALILSSRGRNDRGSLIDNFT